MTTDDTYNGWVNRETWCLALHLSNDASIYGMVRDMARDAWETAEEERDADEFGWFRDGILTLHAVARRSLADSLQNLVEDVAADIPAMIRGRHDDYSPLSDLLVAAILDTGSLYRVEFWDIAEGYVDDVAEEMAAEDVDADS